MYEKRKQISKKVIDETSPPRRMISRILTLPNSLLIIPDIGISKPRNSREFVAELYPLYNLRIESALVKAPLPLPQKLEILG